mgnify:CR=1 FL=1
MANLNQTTMADSIKVAYERRLLTRALPRMVHSRWAMKPRISKYGSWEVRKFGSLSTVTSALTEGTTPVEQTAPSVTTTTITPVFYGAFIIYTDEMDLTVYDPVLSETSSILGEQCGLSNDTLVRNELVTDSTIDYSADVSAVGSLDSPQHDISFTDIVKQIGYLEAENALPVDGEDFIIILHPHSYATLMMDETFVNMFIQESPDNAIRNGYVGRILRCKVFVSSNAYEWADVGAGSTTDVYAALFIARESYAILGLDGASMPSEVDSGSETAKPLTGQQIKPVEIITKPLGSAGTNDPLNQRGSMAWKMCLTPEILNSSWIRCLKHTNAFSDD